ncbi:MAG TPA: hypothetical protein VGM98_19485 [Schlesneria sp.]|jgi:hypothetical protein
MFISMLFMTCVIGAQPIEPRQPIVSQTLPTDYPRGVLCLPPTSALNAVRVESEIDPGPTSAFTALGVDQATVDADPTYPSSVTTEVAEILNKCEAASRQIKTSKVMFDRTIYNLVFEIETRSEGELCFEAPDKQSIDLRGVTIPKHTKSQRLASRSGHPFRLESGRNESWILTKDEIAAGNDDEKTYERFQRPTQVPDHASSWFNFFYIPGAYPFLFDIRADQIRTDWNVTLLSQKEQQTALKALPRTARITSNFKECLILIDNKTWRVFAVKYYDSSGNLETVYKLGERTMNEPLPADCFEPALKWPGYKEFKVD